VLARSAERRASPAVVRQWLKGLEVPCCLAGLLVSS
jgi:hypothetical protein